MRALKKLCLALVLGLALVAPTSGQVVEEAAAFPGQEVPWRDRFKSLRIEMAIFSFRRASGWRGCGASRLCGFFGCGDSSPAPPEILGKSEKGVDGQMDSMIMILSEMNY